MWEFRIFEYFNIYGRHFNIYPKCAKYNFFQKILRSIRHPHSSTSIPTERYKNNKIYIVRKYKIPFYVVGIYVYLCKQIKYKFPIIQQQINYCFNKSKMYFNNCTFIINLINKINTI